MGAFLYGISLQWRLDLRSRTLLITCYIVPLLFFAVMGGIFTSVMPGAGETLIQSMTVFGVTIFKEKLSRKKCIALAMILAGILIYALAG